MPAYVVEYEWTFDAAKSESLLDAAPLVLHAVADRTFRPLDIGPADSSASRLRIQSEEGEPSRTLVRILATPSQAGELAERAKAGDGGLRSVMEDPPIHLLQDCTKIGEQGSLEDLYRQLEFETAPSAPGVLIVMVDDGFSATWLRNVQGRTFVFSPEASFAFPGSTPGQQVGARHGNLTASAALAVAPRCSVADAAALPRGGANATLFYVMSYFREVLVPNLPLLDRMFTGIVVNNSWGLDGPVHDPQLPFRFEQILAALDRFGLDVTFAAGNCGPCRSGPCPPMGPYILGPAASSSVLSVGASLMDGTISPISSRGPGPNNVPKPDVVAPSNFHRVGAISGHTSASCALASGLIAEARTRYPRGRVSAKDLRAMARSAGHYDPAQGFGLMRRIP